VFSTSAGKISSAAIALMGAVIFASFVMLAAAVLPSSAAEGMQYIYDYAGIFSDSEKTRLQALAQEYSTRTNVHFVILTTDDSSARVLETYSRNFYDQHIAGADGITECAMMSVNMSTRVVANDFYGELRTMVSDNEASVIREGYGKYMSSRNYGAAARYFLDEAAKLVEEKIALYNVDVADARQTAHIKMVDEAQWALLWSLLAAVALPAVVLLVIYLMHNAGMKKKISTRNYLVSDSLRLHYISDVFLHTHTSRSKKERKSDSKSSRSGGGRASSRSEGRF
jgi:uncharacterized protein